MFKNALKSLLVFSFVSATVTAFLGMAAAQQAHPSDLWPLQRQYLLIGTYVGKLNSYKQDCQVVHAELSLSMATPSSTIQRYTLKTTCMAGGKPNAAPATITGSWDMDQKIGSCLILNFVDSNDPMIGPTVYGFSVEPDAASDGTMRPNYILAQDGDSCHSGRPPEDADKVLRKLSL
ncbi:hypothetical protein [Xanthomonas campestris]|uniref:hypothetical protein n=1 Tax=Xanthomonas campestris TaxID=339 RepID=UPI002B23AFAA|nr:hypothetical protein [Xanthomonas campestris]MEA9921903.1 hypothetical protein [Xanthomonas campestris pv. raphani]MEC5194516.1 hypothetical protein [Xanthomonas campestris]